MAKVGHNGFIGDGIIAAGQMDIDGPYVALLTVYYVHTIYEIMSV